MAIELKAQGSPANLPPFSFNDIDEEVDTSSESSPEIPVADLPSPPTTWLPSSEMNTYGARPLVPEAPVIKCPDCSKPIMGNSLAEHAENCEKIRNGEFKKPASKASKDDDGNDVSAGNVSGKKRKADDTEPLAAPDTKKKKKAGTTAKKSTGKNAKVPKVKGPLDLDTRCGVYDEKKGAVCQRRITCKVHSMHAKRQLPGRSKNFDELLLEYRRIHDPKFVEPVPKKPKEKKEPGVPGVGKDGLTKKERKELREKERMEKREADIRAGLIDPNDPAHALPQPKKKKKKTAAPGVSGGTGGKKGAGAAGTGGQAAGTGGGANGSVPGEWDSMDEDEIAELDSDVEIDKLISAVSRSKRAGQQTGVITGYSLFPPSVVSPASQAGGGTSTGTKGGASNAASQTSVGGPTPLARSTNTTHYFVARNEVLRCCADILLKALPRPTNSVSVVNPTGSAVTSSNSTTSSAT